MPGAERNTEHASTHAAETQTTVRAEGIVLGLSIGVATWLSIAAIDYVFATPFGTFRVLGGIAAYTIVHLMLWALLGSILVALVRAAVRTPPLILGIVFGALLLVIAIAMWTVMLSNLGLGALAWVQVFGAGVLGLALMFGVLARRYPLAELLERSQQDLPPG